ncbi:hypothetical protein RBU49_03380 [Clostridium sp. MB40-C1]|uniref:hypothetical protein n=1 Tax=Clostridium sp. MB40-C1 TaxID=3070996 RepID=UPI0027E11669|nr:hypothetical protein [Clostridium sp. MB40-C1]WMJ81312.1 hypothetical protein RBU49_03380 [Clostridium sp. MB40-C1]
MENKIVELIDSILNISNDIQNTIIKNEIDNIYIMEFVSSLAKLSKEAHESQYSDLDIDELNEKLNSLLNALEDKDMILFSDNLEYELKPLLEYWKEVIQ